MLPHSNIEDISRQIAVEEAILSVFDAKVAHVMPAEMKTAADLCRLRITALRGVLAMAEAAAAKSLGGGSPSAAMARIAEHFDAGTKGTPYRVFRGPSPADVPSLAKDIRILFQLLAVQGVYAGKIPDLDPRYDRVAA